MKKIFLLITILITTLSFSQKKMYSDYDYFGTVDILGQFNINSVPVVAVSSTSSEITYAASMNLAFTPTQPNRYVTMAGNGTLTAITGTIVNGDNGWLKVNGTGTLTVTNGDASTLAVTVAGTPKILYWIADELDSVVWYQDETGAGGALTDGDKGDITVSASGATWTIDNSTIDIANLSATGTPSASTYLRGDNTWATAGSFSGDIGVATGTRLALTNTTNTKSFEVFATNITNEPVFKLNHPTNTKAFQFAINGDALAYASFEMIAGKPTLALGNGTLSRDITLYRDAANVLKTDDTFTANTYRVNALNTAPANATATGVAGEIRITATHIYVCTATNTWVRTALATW